MLWSRELGCIGWLSVSSILLLTLCLLHTMSLCLHSGLMLKASGGTKPLQSSAVVGGQDTQGSKPYFGQSNTFYHFTK